MHCNAMYVRYTEYNSHPARRITSGCGMYVHILRFCQTNMTQTEKAANYCVRRKVIGKVSRDRRWALCIKVARRREGGGISCMFNLANLRPLLWSSFWDDNLIGAPSSCKTVSRRIYLHNINTPDPSQLHPKYPVMSTREWYIHQMPK